MAAAQAVSQMAARRGAVVVRVEGKRLGIGGDFVR